MPHLLSEKVQQSYYLTRPRFPQVGLGMSCPILYMILCGQTQVKQLKKPLLLTFSFYTSFGRRLTSPLLLLALSFLSLFYLCFPSLIIVIVNIISSTILTFLAKRIRRIKPRLASVGACPVHLVTHIARWTVPTRKHAAQAVRTIRTNWRNDMPQTTVMVAVVVHVDCMQSKLSEPSETKLEKRLVTVYTVMVVLVPHADCRVYACSLNRVAVKVSSNNRPTTK